ncbi:MULTISPECIES: DUF2291 family protein [unclassified Streptosporangium]|uniref:DUF2291 family protein n=1 Tax=unclassified Streptosporangium TaxID=2632669 RepID=UPI002E2A9CC2|nr:MULTISPECIES: DUF2291 domain-containing protein [unclassified Streptosporangium]
MSTPVASQARGGQLPRRRIPARWIAVALATALLAAIGFSTQYRPAESVAAGPRRFDPTVYGARTYEDKVVPVVERKAVELPVLVRAMTDDMKGAEKQYGVRQGNGPYNFAVKGTGTAGAVESGLMPVAVRGLPPHTRVSLQVGPVINGTALRDVVGFITFEQFLNQVEYADAATALNDQMREKLLKHLDAPGLKGKKISFVGAFSFLTPSVVTITPVSIKETS